MAISILISIVLMEITGYSDVKNFEWVPKFSTAYLIEVVCIPVILTIVLFMGPIFLEIEQGIFLNINQYQDAHIMARNLFLAPVLEEILYRGILVHILSQCYSPFFTLLISSILFSISHIPKHIFDQDFEFSYDWRFVAAHCIQTFVFSTYVCTVGLKTGSILPPILIHCLCNYFESPAFDILMETKHLRIATIAGLGMFLIFFYSFMTA